jgi:hypothetical protein
MAIKLTALLFIGLFAPSAICQAEDVFKGSPRMPFTAAENLKNYGLSSCLADGLESREAKKDAEDAAGGYLELGSRGIAAYQEVAKAGRHYLEKKYLSHGGGKLVTMRCINFFYSKELDLIVKKHLRRNKRNSHE